MCHSCQLLSEDRFFDGNINSDYNSDLNPNMVRSMKFHQPHQEQKYNISFELRICRLMAGSFLPLIFFHMLISD